MKWRLDEMQAAFCCRRGKGRRRKGVRAHCHSTTNRLDHACPGQNICHVVRGAHTLAAAAQRVTVGIPFSPPTDLHVGVHTSTAI